MPMVSVSVTQPVCLDNIYGRSKPGLSLLLIHSSTGVSLEERDLYGLEHTIHRAGISTDDDLPGKEFADSVSPNAHSGLLPVTTGC